MGGQGGGVLANWLIEAAKRSGWLAQSTAVPGVAQRTGATVYYLEIWPRQAGGDSAPVLALMPVPGHVDVLVAGELAEAGRALQRGLIAPQRTAVIVSTHRDYAIDEKSTPGDGRIDAQRLIAIVRENAKRFVGFDMAALAEQTDSAISAVLLGAIAGSGALPLASENCAAAIGDLGIAVQANLKGFEAGCGRVRMAPEQAAGAAEPASPVAGGHLPQAARHKEAQALLERVHSAFPEEARPVLVAALRKLIDYQDPRYANAFLEWLVPVLELDSAAQNYRLTIETARYLALGMTYEDVIRVADLKTRSTRFARVRDEVQADPANVVAVEEFMHPRVEEICDVMPAWAGSRCLNTPALKSFIGFFCRKGRRIKTTNLGGFLLLYLLAGLRPLRRGTLRYKAETASLQDWLARVKDSAPVDYELAVEVARCRRLVKGYGETHARGLSNFNRIMAAVEQLCGQPDAGARVQGLCAAALADGENEAFDNAVPDSG